MRGVSFIMCAIALTVAGGVVEAQQTACGPAMVVAPDFGWRATACERCVVHAAYLEYLTPPRISDIRTDGPAAGKLRDDDILLAVDDLDVTTPDAWAILRDAAPNAGRAVRFKIQRDRDTLVVAVKPTARCVPIERVRR